MHLYKNISITKISEIHNEKGLKMHIGQKNIEGHGFTNGPSHINDNQEAGAYIASTLLGFPEPEAKTFGINFAVLFNSPLEEPYKSNPEQATNYAFAYALFFDQFSSFKDPTVYLKAQCNNLAGEFAQCFSDLTTGVGDTDLGGIDKKQLIQCAYTFINAINTEASKSQNGQIYSKQIDSAIEAVNALIPEIKDPHAPTPE